MKNPVNVNRRTALVIGGVATVVAPSLLLETSKLEAAGEVSAGPVTIGVAASLRFAFEDALALWQRQSAPHNGGGSNVRFVFGATSTLVHQIENGAPIDALFAADRKGPKRLADRGITTAPPEVFARGRLALIAAKSSGVKIDETFDGLEAALDDNTLKRFAIANPQLAPYGAAARQALQRAKLWQRLQMHLALGENVGQAAQFAASGAAQAGLIALSLTRGAKLSSVLNIATVREDWHEPIDHTMVRLKTSSPTADGFCAFAKSVEMSQLLARHGFSAPAA